ncbi:hypothetical protein [Halorubrum sp. DTA46]|uniref:hypothetical protein n=1 Tax=Halorubrum sp. DTA46 TaxID=3402162 RepID=UPI003AB05A03
MSLANDAEENGAAADADPDPRVVKSRVKDPELLKAIEEAEADSTLSAVIRDSLRMALLNDGEAPSTGRHLHMPDRRRLREAYRTLAETAGIPIAGAGLRVRREEARDALYTSRTPKKEVFRTLIEPLMLQGFVNVDRGHDKTWVTVRPLAPAPSDDADCALCGAEDCTVFLTERDHPAGRNYAACASCHGIADDAGGDLDA